MIWLIGGTRDSRDISGMLLAAGRPFFVTAATTEGTKIISSAEVDTRVGRLTREGMGELFKTYDLRLVIDASHPFAAEVSHNAMAVCRWHSVPYLRFERPRIPLPLENGLVHRAASMKHAAETAFDLGNAVLLTIGVKDLPVFVDEWQRRRRGGNSTLELLVKVLPLVSSIRECERLGLAYSQVIASGKPFGEALYHGILKDYQLDVVVTKESGEVGGVKEKVRACVGLGRHVVIVDRPPLAYPDVVQDLASLQERIGVYLDVGSRKVGDPG